MQHPENVATGIVLRFLGSLRRERLHVIPEDRLRGLRDSIRDAIQTAVQCEREACARVADAELNGTQIALAIRLRRRAKRPRVWRRGESPVLS